MSIIYTHEDCGVVTRIAGLDDGRVSVHVRDGGDGATDVVPFRDLFAALARHNATLGDPEPAEAQPVVIVHVTHGDVHLDDAQMDRLADRIAARVGDAARQYSDLNAEADNTAASDPVVVASDADLDAAGAPEDAPVSSQSEGEVFTAQMTYLDPGQMLLNVPYVADVDGLGDCLVWRRREGQSDRLHWFFIADGASTIGHTSIPGEVTAVRPVKVVDAWGRLDWTPK